MIRGSVLSPSLRGCLFYLALYGDLAVYLPFLNVYFRQLGLSGWDIGLLAALFPTMTFLLTPPLSVLADHRRWRTRMLAVSALGVAGALMLLSFPSTFLALAPLVALLAICRCPIVPLSDSIIARMASRHALNYGGMRLWGSLSFALVSIVCGAVWQHVGYRPMFVVAGVLSIPVGWAALTLDEGEVVERHARAPFRMIGHDTVLVLLLVATFLVGSAIFMDLTFVGIYMVHLGGSNLLVGMLFGTSALSELPTMRYGALVSRYIGDSGSLLLSYGLFGFAYLGYTVAPGPTALLLFSGLRGMAYGLFYVSTIRFITERTPPEWSATLQGAMNAMAFGLAQLISGPVSGRIYDSAGPVAVYVACIIVISAAVLLMGSVAGIGLLQKPDAESIGETSQSS